MHICRVVASFPSLKRSIGPSEGYLGPNVYCISLAQVSSGEKVTIVTGRDGTDGGYENIQGVEIVRVGKPFNITAPRKILEIDRSNPIDVVHIHAANCFTAPVLGELSERFLLVSHVHGTTSGSEAALNPGREGYETLLRERIQWGMSDAVFGVSNATCGEVINHYGISPDKVHTAYNAADLELFFPRPPDTNIPLGENVALFVGQIGPRKGLEILRRSAELVSDEFGDALFLLAGGAPGYAGQAGQQYYQDLKHALSCDFFRFLGPVPHIQLPQHYSSADIFVFPTLYEGFPKAMLEAMACETPIVSTDVGGIPEMVRNGIEGFLVGPRDSKTLADSICRMFDDRQMTLKMGRRARKRVSRCFTWAQNASKLRRVYELSLTRR